MSKAAPALRAALVLCLLLILSPEADAGEREAEPGESVVLLHGLGRTSGSMGRLERFLRGHGYRVVNLGYPSRRKPIGELSRHLHERLASCCAGERPLHFVTHSLGGILLRYAHAERPIAGLGRVVMLAPPSQGSEWVDLLEASGLDRGLLGPSGQDLGTREESAPSRLKPPDFELGIVAGERSLNPLGSWLIPGPDDGTVAVERTRLEGMADFAVVPHSHSFIMRSPRVHELVLRFLRDGRFEPGSESGEAGGRGD